MPSPSVPLGYAVCSAVFTISGASRTPTITMGFRPGGVMTAAQVNTIWRNVLIASGGPYVQTFVPTVMSLVETRALVNNGGFLFSDVDFTAFTGTSAAAPPSMNTAVLINKNTGLAGRKYRGRIFSPVCTAESNISAAGLISGGDVSAYQSRWNQAYTQWIAQDLEPRLIHQDGSTPTLISSFTVSERVGTIGRRMRR